MAADQKKQKSASEIYFDMNKWKKPQVVDKAANPVKSKAAKRSLHVVSDSEDDEISLGDADSERSFDDLFADGEGKKKKNAKSKKLKRKNSETSSKKKFKRDRAIERDLSPEPEPEDAGDWEKGYVLLLAVSQDPKRSHPCLHALRWYPPSQAIYDLVIGVFEKALYSAWSETNRLMWRLFVEEVPTRIFRGTKYHLSTAPEVFDRLGDIVAKGPDYSCSAEKKSNKFDDDEDDEEEEEEEEESEDYSDEEYGTEKPRKPVDPKDSTNDRLARVSAFRDIFSKYPAELGWLQIGPGRKSPVRSAHRSVYDPLAVYFCGNLSLNRFDRIE